MEMNEVLDRLPQHLLDFIVDHPFGNYTPEDHAVWRYVMHQSLRYLPEIAHESYVRGLKHAEIPIEHIPHIYGKDRILKHAGWAAVAVDGFIPPSAFMEFQSYNVIVIAADMRPIGQIEYTPAPDIIHEASGHTPLIVDNEYAEYLRCFGELGSKAFFSKNDQDFYEATRLLSILKIDPYSEPDDIAEVEAELKHLAGMAKHPSELARLQKLHWWTVEYGLIGGIDQPKIYGAGLLSSISEGFDAVKNGVDKVPYSLQACMQNFDITKPQPQLFVTPSFGHLNTVLAEFADGMAINNGGHEGVSKAIESNSLSTLVLDSGIQISGVFEHFEEVNGIPIYVGSTGESALSFQNQQILGFDKVKFKNGIAVPLGRPTDTNKPFWQFSEDELVHIGLFEGNSFILEFSNRLKIQGVFRYDLRKDGRLVLLCIDECMLSLFDRPLFDNPLNDVVIPIGEVIISAFQGVADPNAFGLRLSPSKNKSQKISYSNRAMARHQVYQQIRGFREKTTQDIDIPLLMKGLDADIANNWLITLELLELTKNKNPYIDESKVLNKKLRMFQEKHPQLIKLIDDGISILK